MCVITGLVVKRCLLCIGVTVVCYNRSCCEVMFVGIGVTVVCYNRSCCEEMFVVYRSYCCVL